MHRYVLALHAIAATALLSPKRRRRAPTKDDGWRELSPPTPLAPRTDYDWTSGTPTDAACWPSVSVVTITRDRADFEPIELEPPESAFPEKLVVFLDSA